MRDRPAGRAQGVKGIGVRECSGEYIDPLRRFTVVYLRDRDGRGARHVCRQRDSQFINPSST